MPYGFNEEGKEKRTVICRSLGDSKLLINWANSISRIEIVLISLSFILIQLLYQNQCQMMIKHKRNQNIQYTKYKFISQNHKLRFSQSFHVIKIKMYYRDNDSLILQVGIPMANTEQGRYQNCGWKNLTTHQSSSSVSKSSISPPLPLLSPPSFSISNPRSTSGVEDDHYGKLKCKLVNTNSTLLSIVISPGNTSHKFVFPLNYSSPIL